jgi:amino acid permease
MKHLKSLLNLAFLVTLYIGFTRPYLIVIEQAYRLIYPVDEIDFWIETTIQMICIFIICRILFKFRKHILIFKDVKKKNIRSAAESLHNDQYDSKNHG